MGDGLGSARRNSFWEDGRPMAAPDLDGPCAKKESTDTTKLASMRQDLNVARDLVFFGAQTRREYSSRLY